MWEYYKTQHKTLGCKVCHIIGIPLILMGILSLSISSIFAGFSMLMIGHKVFEKNDPAFFRLFKR